MQKLMLALLTLAPIVIARKPWLARKARPNPTSRSRHADAVRELALAMREAEAHSRSRAPLRLIAASS